MSSKTQVSSLVCQRYAKALIQQAESVKKLDKVEQDVKDLSAMIESSDDLRNVIRSPLFNQVSLSKALFAIADKAKFQDVTKSFLGTLIENGRLNILEQVIAAFGVVLSKKRGELEVEVKVAQDLSAKQRKDLEAALSKSLGGAVAMDVQVDPSILGGMIVTAGSCMVDDSIARKLERLRADLGRQKAA